MSFSLLGKLRHNSKKEMYVQPSLLFILLIIGEPGGDNTPRDKLTAGSGGSSSDAQVRITSLYLNTNNNS